MSEPSTSPPGKSALRWLPLVWPLGILLSVGIFVGIRGHSVFSLRSAPAAPAPALLEAAHGRPLPPVAGPRRVYHLGHSLVGRDMPAMLAQLAPAGHAYESQLGWGASLRAHFEPDVPVPGFEAENAHPRFRPAREAIASGDYDALILTEMVELRDALRFHDSALYLQRWADLARAAAPHTEVFLYETWHRLDDPAGWLERLDRDLPELWLARLADPELMVSGPERPLRLIPAGQVLAAFVRDLEARGGQDGLQSRADLFARTPEGQLDPIHLGDLGNYLVALTHFAVLYRQSPIGLPHQLRRADGSPAQAPAEPIARRMQELVWSVVTREPRTGVPR
jgi:hypothetical protein